MSAAATRDDTTPYPRESYAWYVIAVLFVVTLFSQLDRQLPSLLVQPIRHAFGISDTGFSLLQGYAFAIVYTLAGLPFGRMVDRTNRRNLIFFGVVIWSVMTILAGFSQTYWQLFATRMGVGVGEAVLAPAAYSIIADYVRPERRGRALGAYYVSLAIGSGASLFLGGLIMKAIPAEGLVLPLIGLLEPWKLMFVLAGAPGLILAFLMFTVVEPARRDTGDVKAAGQQGSVGELVTYLRRHSATFSRILTYPAILAIIGYGQLAWAPAFYARKFAMTPSTTGVTIGALVAVAGLVGSLMSAFLSDYWVAKKVASARLRVTLVAWAFILPSVLVWPLVANLAVSLVFLAFAVGGASIAQAAAPAIIQEVTPNRMRGQAIAIYLLLGGLLGIGFGPTSIALVTDQVFKDDAALPYSIVAVCLPMALLGFWLSASGLKAYDRTAKSLAAGEG
jgi:MFS family permease